MSGGTVYAASSSARLTFDGRRSLPSLAFRTAAVQLTLSLDGDEWSPGIQNYSRFPSTLESSIFGALHWMGHIYDSSAQKPPRALAHSNRLQHTVHRQLVPGRHRAIRVGCGAAPRRLGGRPLRGRQRRAGAIPGTTAAAWLRWSLPNGRLRFLH